jgi:hypothetical protein
MNEQTDHLDHADEEVPTYTLSDEALEAAAGRIDGLVSRFATIVGLVPLPGCRV